MEEPNIYAGIYDVVAENLTNAGKTFGYMKSTFLCDVGEHPRVVRVSKYDKMDNASFYQGIFVAAFKRLPDEDEWKDQEEFMWLRNDMFQLRVLNMMDSSLVLAINQMEVYDNPEFEQERGAIFHLLGRLYGLTDKSWLRELGKRMPKPIQRMIRKVFL